AEVFLQNIYQQLQQLNIEATQIIFTVPVGASERYLDWFWDLAEKLSLPQVQLVDESTAAALGYAIKRPGSVVLVVDFGGGTLDLSLIRTSARQNQTNKVVLQAEVIAKSDAYVGGEDIDIWIVEDYLQQTNSSREAIGEIGWQNLLELAEKLKIRLSQTTEAKESWFDEESFMSYELQLTQDKLAEILENRQLLEQLRNVLDEVIRTAFNQGVNKSSIEQVVLVGGSCLIPAIQQLIQSYFGKNKVKLDKPFQAVSHGALTLNNLENIQDNLRHSYAIRIWEPFNNNYFYYTLFPKGTSYPCQREEILTLRVANEGQTEIRLDIGELAETTQGEVEYDSQGRMTSGYLLQNQEYRSLQSASEEVCLAKLNPPGEIGIDRLAIEFAVNERRVLLATVTDLLTQKVLWRDKVIARL
ncbi:MAG: Hsp70 family protein, partial [Spirulinaceae cyanobacterium]